MDLSHIGIFREGDEGVHCITEMTPSGPLKLLYRGSLDDLAVRVLRSAIEFNRLSKRRPSERIKTRDEG